ncbi:GNAT family N-acetyltransferase [Nonomuraea sp. NPDC050394]|uniref:GNAT family N-acetyltransferase n=1 Tax=Nonomuraea sp. NPDC050394 TaxID=3364363 RepID=UPI0037AC1DBD
MTVIVNAEASPVLFLRPWRDDDLAPLVSAYRDPELRKWTLQPIVTDDDGRRWLDLQHRGWESGERLSFAVREEGKDALLGNVVMKRADPQGDTAEVGYWTAAPARGRGVAPRAVESLTAWAFATYPDLALLELLHQVDNLASCRVAEKTGFLFEEILPAEAPYPYDGHRHCRRRPD